MEFLHDDVVAKLWPGDEPIALGEHRNSHLLGSALARPFQSAFGQDQYENILEKAAALFHSLIANHPFFNGNKRTAVLAVECFLLANDYFLLLSNDEMYRLATDTATYRQRGVSHEQIFQQIVNKLDKSVSLRGIKGKGLIKLRRLTLQAKRNIRSHPLNEE